ncbi:alpha/beta fold hydrolase [Pseudonocardia lacus]|uniref:alpha/beta fold hydrolase n=1 Tax=Pseudonocardia lacus TaxID=2835865 RepID=UPI001BDC0D84|nr:alpha/beta hydrolase [Pseudonocardia lacus]
MSSYLLVHGAWCGGWVWDDLAQRLEKAGHRVTAVDRLPSAGTDPASLGDLTADADHVRRVLDTLDEPVVLVGHSYGGMVITELADHPKVRHTVYLAAFWPQRGQSLLDMLGGGAMPNWIVPRDDGALEITDDLELARDTLCADLDRDRTREMLSKAVLQSGSAFVVPSTAPDRGHPTTYMITERESDNCIPVAAQEAMAANADQVVRLPAAHMVQLSRPDELAQALDRI